MSEPTTITFGFTGTNPGGEPIDEHIFDKGIDELIDILTDESPAYFYDFDVDVRLSTGQLWVSMETTEPPEDVFIQGFALVVSAIRRLGGSVDIGQSIGSAGREEQQPPVWRPATERLQPA